MKYLILMMLLLFVSGTGVAQTAQKLVLTANVSQSECAGSGHTIALTASGGTAPYTFAWSDGKTGAFRNDLEGGVYTCTVRDTQGMSEKQTFTLTKLPLPVTAAVRQEKATDQTTVHIEAKGGTRPYTYFWVGNGIRMEQSSQPSKKLTAGTYQVVVQDTNNCTTMLTLTIE